MTVYAIFLCMQLSGDCQQVEAGRYSLGDWLPGTIYASIEDCRYAIHQKYAPNVAPDRQWRFKIRGDMWYVCLGRQVNAWEQPQE